jgi:hypothetical protein
MATNLGAYVWVAYLSSALITVSVGAILVSVAQLVGARIGTAAIFALAVAMLVVMSISYLMAHTYFRAMTAVTARRAPEPPKELPTAE